MTPNTDVCSKYIILYMTIGIIIEKKQTKTHI